MCVCVCMDIGMHVYMYAFMYAYTCTYIYTYVCVRMHVCACVVRVLARPKRWRLTSSSQLRGISQLRILFLKTHQIVTTNKYQYQQPKSLKSKLSSNVHFSCCFFVAFSSSKLIPLLKITKPSYNVFSI